MTKRPSIRPDGAPRLGDKFTDWRDFTNRVCRPWLENDSEDPKVDGWYAALFVAADPWYLACALVIADNRLRELEASPDDGSRTA
jgi:hypothetical protein